MAPRSRPWAPCAASTTAMVPFLLGLLGYWVIGMSSGYLFGFVWGFGAIGIWWGLALGLAASATMLSWRFHRRTGRCCWRRSGEQDEGAAEVAPRCRPGRARPRRQPRQGAGPDPCRRRLFRRAPPRQARPVHRRRSAARTARPGPSLGLPRRPQARHALDHFAIDPAGRHLGSTSAPRPAASPTCCWRAAPPRSTPSMSATSQLAWKLRQDPRVVVLERTNAAPSLARRDSGRLRLASSATPASSASK